MRKTIGSLLAVGVLMAGGCRSDEPQSVELESHTNSIGMKFLLVPAGEFQRGGGESVDEVLAAFPGSKRAQLECELPQHLVKITKPFYVGVTEVTQEQYQKVVGSNPAANKNPTSPVTNITWDEAIEFCKRLSEMEKRTYRLPTEAEYEYACRAGSEKRWCFGDEVATLGDYAWFSGNSANTIHPVAEKKANAWGLFDMHGNVAEWCQDWYEEEFYSSKPKNDPTGPISGSGRTFRGGGMDSPPVACRSAFRDRALPTVARGNVGLRVVLDP